LETPRISSLILKFSLRTHNVESETAHHIFFEDPHIITEKSHWRPRESLGRPLPSPLNAPETLRKPNFRRKKSPYFPVKKEVFDSLPMLLLIQ